MSLTVDTIIPASQMALWLKSSLGLTAGTPPLISAWDDLSTNNNDASQATASFQPSLISGYVDFDGVDNCMGIADAASLDPTTAFTIAMRVRPDSLAGSTVWLSKSDSGAAGEWYVQYSGELRFGCGAGIAGNAPAGSFSAGVWTTVVMIYDGAGSGNPGRLRWRVNGVEQTCTYYGTIPATLTAGTTPVTLGCFSDFAQFFDGAFAEIVFVNAATTVQQTRDLEYVLTYGPLYGAGNAGTVQVDFGAFPGQSDASVAITGQTGIGAGSLVEAWLFPAQTLDHSIDEHLVETISVRAGTIVPGVGFTVYATNTSEINEPLEMVGPSKFRSAATTVYGYVSPSSGGTGTRLYGLWNVGWVWV